MIMRKVSHIIVATFAVLLLATIATATAGAQQLVQGWQSKQVHAHIEFQNPMFQTINPGTQVSVRVLYHNNAKTAQWLRWQDYGNTKFTDNFADWTPGAAFEAERTETLTMSPAQFDHWGYREVRVGLNSVSPRDFSTTRWCVFVPDNGKGRSDNCGGPNVQGRCGAGWWYQETEYSVVFVDCRDIARIQAGPVPAGFKIRARAQAGTLIAALDPDFHHGNDGTPLPVSGGAVTIPTGLAPGTHKIHFRDQRSNGQAGAYVVVVQVA